MQMATLRIENYQETGLEGSCLDVLEGIQVPGEEAPTFQQAYEFLSALSEEIDLMKGRALSGDPVALGYVDVLTRAMR